MTATCTNNPLSITNIIPEERTDFFVEWSVDTSIVGSGPFTFKLFRSGSPDGPYTEITPTGGVVDTFFFRDTLPLLHGMTKDLYYQVSAEPGNLQSFPANPTVVSLPTTIAMVQRKIINDERILLKKFTGIPLVVFKKKHWGTRCIQCYDCNTGQTVLSQCAECFGTTFEGGYFSPIHVLGMIKPTTIGMDPAAQTSIPEVDTASGFLQPFPTVIKGDILVEAIPNKRWEVTAVQSTELQRSTVHQDITVSRLSTAHPVYKLSY